MAPLSALSRNTTDREASRVAGAQSCALCGLPVRSTRDTGAAERFCCTGCRNVWQIIRESADYDGAADLSEHPLVIQARSLGLLTPGEDQTVFASTSAASAPSDAGSVDDLRLCVLPIRGMWCSSCAWLIAETLRRTRGVAAADVSFTADAAHVTYQPARVGVEQLHSVVESLGYSVSLTDNEDDEEAQRRASMRAELIRAGVAFILAMNVMMINIVLYTGNRVTLGPTLSRIIPWILFTLSVPVMACGLPLFNRAVRAGARGAATMETLISIGSLSAFSYSVYELLRGSTHGYFDTADMLIGLVLVGKYIERSLRAGGADAVRLLHRLIPRKATVLHEGRERAVQIAQLGPGDCVVVRTGERLPADGIVASGSGGVDESLMTGESKPVTRRVGDRVTGGSMLIDGQITVTVSESASTGSVSQIAALVADAVRRKSRTEQQADRISRVFVPFVLLAAAATGIIVRLHGGNADEILTRTVAVLVIACPCALGIATPMAVMAGVAAAAKSGVVISDPDALEKLARVRRVIFDKTGTLTAGEFELRECVARSASIEELAAVESMSEHPVARAIVRTFERDREDLPEVTSYIRVPGRGVTGNVPNGRTIVAGNADLVSQFGLTFPDDLETMAAAAADEGHTTIWFGALGCEAGLVVLGDVLRTGAKTAADRLTACGIATEIVSGDNPRTVRAIASKVGISHWRAQVRPEEKAAIISHASSGAHSGMVAMVGDGVNDAAALASADIGIALGSGSDIAARASAATLLASDLTRIPLLIRMSTETVAVLRQNLVWAFLYNALGIPLAIAGYISPVWAAGAMLISSITVLLNTRRLAARLDKLTV